MGFLNKLAAANGFNLGNVESPDFPCCTLQISNGKPVIRGKALNSRNPDYFIEEDNIEVFELVGCGGTWAKYRIAFKDGKSAIITQEVIQPNSGATGVTMAPIERYIKEKRSVSIVSSHHSTNEDKSFENKEEKNNEQPNANPVNHEPYHQTVNEAKQSNQVVEQNSKSNEEKDSLSNMLEDNSAPEEVKQTIIAVTSNKEKDSLSNMLEDNSAPEEVKQTIIAVTSNKEKHEPRASHIENTETTYEFSEEILIETNKDYIEPAPLTDNLIFWNNHSRGDHVRLDSAFNNVPKGTIGVVLGIDKNMYIDVQFMSNGKPFVVSLLNQYITNLTLKEKIESE